VSECLVFCPEVVGVAAYHRFTRRLCPPRPSLLSPRERSRASDTLMDRPLSSVPSNSEIARCASLSALNSMNPNPRDRPVSRSWITVASSTSPHRPNTSRRSCDVDPKWRFPTKSLIPITSYLCTAPLQNSVERLGAEAFSDAPASFGNSRHAEPTRAEETRRLAVSEDQAHALARLGGRASRFRTTACRLGSAAELRACAVRPLRGEFVDLMILVNERHLRRRLRRCAAEHCPPRRMHRLLGKDTPAPPTVPLPETGQVVECPVVFGLRQRNAWGAARAAPLPASHRSRISASVRPRDQQVPSSATVDWLGRARSTRYPTEHGRPRPGMGLNWVFRMEGWGAPITPGRG